MKKLWMVTLTVLAVFASSGATMADEHHGSSVNLIGRSLFGGYLSDSGFAFLPLDQFACPATGTLTRMDKKTYALLIHECGEFRLSIWNLQITGHDGASDDGEEEDSGHGIRDHRDRLDVLRSDGSKTDFVFPELVGGTFNSQVEIHTGCTLNGTFPIYHGTWDGKTLYISTHFQSPGCGGGSLWGLPGFWSGVSDPDGHLADGLTPDDGPVHVTFAFEMYAVE